MEATSSVATSLLPLLPFQACRSAARCTGSVPCLLLNPLRPFLGGDRLCASSRRCYLYHPRGVRLRQNVSGEPLHSEVKLEDEIDDEACELVSGVEIVIGEGHDSIRAYLLKAVKNNNGTGVLLLSDISGFDDSATRDFAYQVACHGYNVLVPDLFRGNPWKKNQPRDKLEHWLSKQSPERVTEDIDACTKWMIDEFMAAGISEKLGIIGFCFGGGRLVEALSQDKQAYFGAGICFYGIRIDPSKAGNLKAPVLYICGDNDPLCPVTTLHQIEKNNQSSRVVIYPGRGHGFAHRPECEEEDQAAEDAFTAARNWLHDNLLASKL